MHIVAFNGPPRSGKDTLSRMLAEHLDEKITMPVMEVSLSTPLRVIAYSMTGWGGDTDGENYEQFKTIHFGEFGKDGRQIMIDISERFLKPTYGLDIMSKMLLGSHEGFDGVMLIRDSGFQNEVDYLSRAVGSENLYVVNVRRAGCDYSNDSREDVHHLFNSQIDNDSSLDDLQTEAVRIYGRLVNQMGWKL